MSGVPIGFSLMSLSLPLEQILTAKKLPIGITETKKFKQIASSITEVGLIEPLSVTPVNGNANQYLLVDGHIRLIVLRDLGYVEVACLVAKDDESYSYNSQVNRLSSIQEHHMIRLALERGVSSERLAKALNLDVRTIARKATLLDGLCPEAIEMLADRQFSHEISRVLRKMKPTRQVECVELMISANNITVPYIEALLVATPTDFLVEGKKPSKLSGISQEQMARMEREMANLQGQYKLVEENYGQDVLNFVLARGYLSKLLENSSVVRYLRQNYGEFFEEFDAIVKTTSLE